MSVEFPPELELAIEGAHEELKALAADVRRVTDRATKADTRTSASANTTTGQVPSPAALEMRAASNALRCDLGTPRELRAAEVYQTEMRRILASLKHGSSPS